MVNAKPPTDEIPSEATPASPQDAPGVERLLTPDDDLVGQRLDRALVTLYPDTSRTRLQQFIKEGGARINGKPGKPGQVLEAGQRLTLALAPGNTPHVGQADLGKTAPRPENIPLDVVYEDEHLLVLNKPTGIVVHPAPGHATGTLVNALLAHDPEIAEAGDVGRPGIVHRLDKDTSGLMVVAKDPETHAKLAAQMAERQMVKRYLALIEGRLSVPEGVIEAPIGRDPRQRQRMALVSEAAGGREARTRFKVLREARGRSLVELQLETGRTHQIRVHLAAVGHPVVGDTTYGRPQPPQPPRIVLHAAHLEFAHPITGEWLSFEAPLPPDLAGFLGAWEQ